MLIQIENPEYEFEQFIKNQFKNDDDSSQLSQTTEISEQEEDPDSLDNDNNFQVEQNNNKIVIKIQNSNETKREIDTLLNRKRSINESTCEKTQLLHTIKEYTKNMNNIRKSAAKCLLIGLKKFIKTEYQTDFDFNLNEVFDSNLVQMNAIFGLKIYQIFCIHEGNEDKIIQMLKKTEGDKRTSLTYFLKKIYKDLYNDFIKDIHSFQIDGKFVNIDTFPTFSETYELKKTKLEKSGKPQDDIKIMMDDFEKVAKNLINDLEDESLRRNVKNKLPVCLKIVKIPELE